MVNELFFAVLLLNLQLKNEIVLFALLYVLMFL